MRCKVVPLEDCRNLFIFLRKKIPFTNLLIYKKQLIKTALFPTILSFSWTIVYLVLYTYPKYIECTLFERSLHYFLFRNCPPWKFLLFSFSALLEYAYWYKGFFVLTQPSNLKRVSDYVLRAIIWHGLIILYIEKKWTKVKELSLKIVYHQSKIYWS